MAAATPKNLVVAVVSDLHASLSTGDKRTSHLILGSDATSISTHPIAGLKHLISKESLRASVLMCPGDLGDRAVPEATEYAWRSVHEIGQLLKVSPSRILGTAGNHDIDSRYEHNDFDAKGYLQTLTPRFPLQNASECDRYWSRHFAFISSSHYRILVLNSSAFHGTTDVEYEHGRVSARTVESIRARLQDSKEKPVNLLLCHHHPHQHSEIGLGEQDLMKGGQALLDLLASGTFGEWLVVHGHKHHPKLSVASSTTSSAPYVFAAGSLSAVLYPELQTNARNQFYLLEFPLAEIATHGLVGRFRAWDWVVGQGWAPARQGSGLPATGGFGCRQTPRTIANAIASAVAEPSVSWADLEKEVPMIRYLLPPDVANVETKLQDEHGIRFLRNRDGVIERVESAVGSH